MALNFYNKHEFVKALLNEREKGQSNFYSMLEIHKASYGKEFVEAIWKHFSVNIEYVSTNEMNSLIETALHPYVMERLNERNKDV